MASRLRKFHIFLFLLVCSTLLLYFNSRRLTRDPDHDDTSSSWMSRLAAQGPRWKDSPQQHPSPERNGSWTPFSYKPSHGPSLYEVHQSISSSTRNGSHDSSSSPSLSEFSQNKVDAGPMSSLSDQGKVSRNSSSSSFSLSSVSSSMMESRDGVAPAGRRIKELELKMLVKAEAEAERFPWFVNVTGRRPDEAHHIVFVKVHKAASTTVQNVFLRFAISRQLNVMFPGASNALSQYSYKMRPLLPHPPSPPFLFDILCNHVIFNHTQIRPYFPPTSWYVAIVRQPWGQVQSAFHYYTTVFRVGYLRTVPSFQDFIQNQSKYEHRYPYHSHTNNRMSIDLGLRPDHLTNASYVDTFLRVLDDTFHLVLVAERFDESMVLLKRTLGWTMKDVVYRKLNALKAQREKISSPDPELEERFQRFQLFDVAVYDHFAHVFQQKVAQQGPDFQGEVKEFMHIEKLISEFCDEASSDSQLSVPASQWNEGFHVQRAECEIMSAKEVVLNSWVKGRQLARLAPAIYDSNTLRGRE